MALRQTALAIAGRCVQVAAAVHAKPLAVFSAKQLCRQLQQQIGHSDLIHIQLRILCNNVFIVITIDGQNNRMGKGKRIRPDKQLQTTVAFRRLSDPV